MSTQQRPDGKWRARVRGTDGKERSAHFATKREARAWEADQLVAIRKGTWIDPKIAKTTVESWCEQWLRGYSVRRASTVRQARTHIKRIVAHFGDRPLAAVRPSEVRDWTAALREEGLADSTVYALHARLAHLFSDAVHDGIIVKSPVSRRTSPPAPKQRPYVATTEQVWALHDAMPDTMKPAILLGAFVGLRAAEIVALRVSDVDFMHGVITPAIQYPGVELKTPASRMPIPIPQDLALELNRIPATWGSTTLVVGAYGRAIATYTLESAFRSARTSVEGLPEGFRLHDLRHYFASLLIHHGHDVKVVQARMRHQSAKTTLDIYSHLWPDTDESARAAVADVFAARADSLRTESPGSQSLG